jgi:CDP-paratose 2-epimerase
VPLSCCSQQVPLKYPYLIKCNIEGHECKGYEYKGTQERDNLRSQDVPRFILEFWKVPRVSEVYNLGGGKENSCSIIKAFQMAERITGRLMKSRYVDENRIGNHICYYSDFRKIKLHYPAWNITRALDSIFRELVISWTKRLAKKSGL